jgi:hypothetical protein
MKPDAGAADLTGDGRLKQRAKPLRLPDPTEISPPGVQGATLIEEHA